MEISELAGRIRDHRFDGWTDTAIADEIEKFGTGDGIASIGTAVEALQQVATALAGTDQTLREQLAKLGVDWQSEAGGQAGQVLSEHAGFSQDAMQKVAHTAEMLFAQGEAFSRTKYKLPDPAAVRKGAESLTLVDSVASFLGFETDHAAAVSAADNARSQAVEALNAYAKQSGENLLSTETLSQPQSLTMVQPGTGPSPVDRAAAAVDVTPDGEVKPSAASVKSQYVAPQPVSHLVDPPTPAYGTAAQAPAPPVRPAAPVVAASYAPPSPPPGWENAPAQGGVRGPDASPRPVGGTTAPVEPGIPGGPGGSRMPGGTSVRPGESGTFLPTGPRGSGPGSGPDTGRGWPGPESFGRPTGDRSGGYPSGTGNSGFSESGNPGGAGNSGSGSGGNAGGTSNLGGQQGGSHTGGGDQALQRGRLVGSAPTPPSSPAPDLGGGPAVPRGGGASAGEMGAGAAALGAGVAGGALAGDRERPGRSQDGQSRGGPVRPLPVGELPEEEAVALRKAEQVAPKPAAGDAKFLSPAAPQEGIEEAEHVRRFGVDDKDLFADGRMVTRDVIGDGTGEVR
ncbi:PPE domain-containing protein [Amycolatopsis benzoatilytica]|uniref:PPE domain-containing protein n=1 Tax=Amycolatopsis benzoatilytica TaxID=346045 RepID=UPI0003A95D4D|nr:PPE domain-containing protein [Amycolatopsis benzoatilytica]